MAATATKSKGPGPGRDVRHAIDRRPLRGPVPAVMRAVTIDRRPFWGPGQELALRLWIIALPVSRRLTALRAAEPLDACFLLLGSLGLSLHRGTHFPPQ